MHHESQHCSSDFFAKRNTAYGKKAKRDVESMAEGKNDGQDTIFELIGRLCGDWRKPWPRIIYVTTSITSKSCEMATNGDRNFDRLIQRLTCFTCSVRHLNTQSTLSSPAGIIIFARMGHTSMRRVLNDVILRYSFHVHRDWEFNVIIFVSCEAPRREQVYRNLIAWRCSLVEQKAEFLWYDL